MPKPMKHWCALMVLSTPTKTSAKIVGCPPPLETYDINREGTCFFGGVLLQPPLEGVLIVVETL